MDLLTQSRSGRQSTASSRNSVDSWSSSMNRLHAPVSMLSNRLLLGKQRRRARDRNKRVATTPLCADGSVNSSSWVSQLIFTKPVPPDPTRPDALLNSPMVRKRNSDFYSDSVTIPLATLSAASPVVGHSDIGSKSSTPRFNTPSTASLSYLDPIQHPIPTTVLKSNLEDIRNPLHHQISHDSGLVLNTPITPTTAHSSSGWCLTPTSRSYKIPKITGSKSDDQIDVHLRSPITIDTPNLTDLQTPESARSRLTRKFSWNPFTKWSTPSNLNSPSWPAFTLSPVSKERTTESKSTHIASIARSNKDLPPIPTNAEISDKSSPANPQKKVKKSRSCTWPSKSKAKNSEVYAYHAFNRNTQFHSQSRSSIKSTNYQSTRTDICTSPSPTAFSRSLASTPTYYQSSPIPPVPLVPSSSTSPTPQNETTSQTWLRNTLPKMQSTPSLGTKPLKTKLSFDGTSVSTTVKKVSSMLDFVKKDHNSERTSPFQKWAGEFINLESRPERERTASDDSELIRNGGLFRQNFHSHKSKTTLRESIINLDDDDDELSESQEESSSNTFPSELEIRKQNGWGDSDSEEINPANNGWNSVEHIPLTPDSSIPSLNAPILEQATIPEFHHAGHEGQASSTSAIDSGDFSSRSTYDHVRDQLMRLDLLLETPSRIRNHVEGPPLTSPNYSEIKDAIQMYETLTMSSSRSTVSPRNADSDTESLEDFDMEMNGFENNQAFEQLKDLLMQHEIKTLSRNSSLRTLDGNELKPSVTSVYKSIDTRPRSPFDSLKGTIILDDGENRQHQHQQLATSLLSPIVEEEMENSESNKTINFSSASFNDLKTALMVIDTTKRIDGDDDDNSSKTSSTIDSLFDVPDIEYIQVTNEELSDLDGNVEELPDLEDEVCVGYVIDREELLESAIKRKL